MTTWYVAPNGTTASGVTLAAIGATNYGKAWTSAAKWSDFLAAGGVWGKAASGDTITFLSGRYLLSAVTGGWKPLTNTSKTGLTLQGRDVAGNLGAATFVGSRTTPWPAAGNDATGVSVGEVFFDMGNASTTITTGSTVLFGASTQQKGTETPAQAYTRVNNALGPLQITRQFDNSQGLTTALNAAKTAGWPAVPAVLSAKYAMATYSDGRFDTEFLAAATQLGPDDYIAIWHEMDVKIANGDFTATQFVTCWKYFYNLAKANGVVAKFVQIYGGFAISTRFAPPFVGDAFCDAIGIDPYSLNTTDTVSSLVDPMVSVIRGYTQKPILIGEIAAQYTGTPRVTFINSFANLNPNVIAVCWFNSPTGDFIPANGTKYDFSIDGDSAASAAYRSFHTSGGSTTVSGNTAPTVSGLHFRNMQDVFLPDGVDGSVNLGTLTLTDCSTRNTQGGICTTYARSDGQLAVVATRVKCHGYDNNGVKVYGPVTLTDCVFDSEFQSTSASGSAAQATAGVYIADSLPNYTATTWPLTATGVIARNHAPGTASGGVYGAGYGILAEENTGTAALRRVLTYGNASFGVTLNCVGNGQTMVSLGDGTAGLSHHLDTQPFTAWNVLLKSGVRPTGVTDPAGCAHTTGTLTLIQSALVAKPTTAQTTNNPVALTIGATDTAKFQNQIYGAQHTGKTTLRDCWEVYSSTGGASESNGYAAAADTARIAAIFGLTPGSSYSYAVRACAQDGSASALSAAVPFTMKPSSSSTVVGFPFRSGVFYDGGALGGPPGNARTFGTARGRAIDVIHEFPPKATWTQWEGVSTSIDGTEFAAGYRAMLSIPPIPNDGASTLAQVAAGTYDSHITTLANNLVARGIDEIIWRFWEPNVASLWFAATGTAGARPGSVGDWNAAIGRIMTKVHAIAPRVRFAICPSRGYRAPTSGLACYPGDQYKAMGLYYFGFDGYDFWYNHPSVTPAQRWSNYLNDDANPSNREGAAQYASFANSHGLTLLIGEWALGNTAWQSNGGGGDDPYFMDQLYAWASNNLGSNGVECYFYQDFGSPGPYHKMATISGDAPVDPKPNAWTEYTALWPQSTTVSGGASTADTTGPATPSTPAVSAVTSSTVTLTWSQVAQDTGTALQGYLFELSTDSGTTWIPVLPGKAASPVTFTGLKPATTYLWRVRSYDVNGNRSGPSSSVTSTTSAGTANTSTPSVPTSPAVASGYVSHHQMAGLQWGAPATGTVAYYEVVNTGTSAVVARCHPLAAATPSLTKVNVHLSTV